MLRLGDHLRACTQALVAEFRWSDAQTINVTSGESCSAREADVEGIEVGALAAQVPALQHRGDVADAAAPRVGITMCILDDPFVDAARFLQIAARAGGDLVGRFLHDAVRGDELGCRRVELAVSAGGRGGAAWLAQVDGAVSGRELACHLDGSRLAFGPNDM